MGVPTQLSDLSATAASNSPAGGDTVGTTMDDFIRAHASIIARISVGTDALATPAIGAATGTSLALGGGTALTTTNRTGTGNLVLATAPTLTGLTVSGGNFVSRGITDSATATALTLSGSGARSVTIANSATNPTIGTSAGDLQLMPASSGKVGIGGIPYSTLDVYGSITSRGEIVNTKNGNSTISAISLNSSYASVSATSAGIAIAMSSNSGVAELRTDGTGTYDIGILTNATRQVHISHTASAVRYLTLTGAIAGGNPTIGTSAGNLAITSSVIATGYYHAFSGTATTAGGYANPGFYMGNAFMGVFWGSGAPSVSAAKGSLYLRSDGSTTNNRMYVNTDGGTTWTAVTTAA